MRTSTKLIAALATAGLAAGAGSAFTSSGVQRSAPSVAFVGGTVSQTVAGSDLTSLAYAYSDGTNTTINQVTATFAVQARMPAAVSVTLTHVAAAVTAAIPCVGSVSNSVWTCATVTSGGSFDSGYVGVTNVEVTVDSYTV